MNVYLDGIKTKVNKNKVVIVVVCFRSDVNT